MRLLPTLEIMDGRAVTLRAGSLDDPQIWITDPHKIVEGFVDDGAEIIQITDFDALRGQAPNDGLILDIIRTTGVPVQVAGGIRSAEHAAFWYDNGANSVVISSWAVQAPQVVAQLAERYPDWVVIGLDIKAGALVTSGWQHKAAITPEAMINAFDPHPIAGYLITDVNRDSDAAQSPTDGQLGLIGQLATSTKHGVTVSGAVYALDDIARINVMPGITGALVSRALFQKRFELAEALREAQPTLEPTAAFR